MAQRITNGGHAVKKNELTPGFPRWASHGSEDNEWWASRQEKRTDTRVFFKKNELTPGFLSKNELTPGFLRKMN